MINKRQQAIEVTIDDISAAHAAFKSAYERDDLHYKTMFGIMNPIIERLQHQSQIGEDNLRELCVHFIFVVTTWNKQAYQNTKYDRFAHFRDIGGPLGDNWEVLMKYRSRKIVDLHSEDQPTVERLYSDFYGVLGRTGAAKGLFLIAPAFFMPWDTAIRKGYKLGEKPTDYWSFLRITHEQVQRIGVSNFIENPTKALDRFNFWHFTRDRVGK
jgi:hypothetical protein